MLNLDKVIELNKEEIKEIMHSKIDSITEVLVDGNKSISILEFLAENTHIKDGFKVVECGNCKMCELYGESHCHKTTKEFLLKRYKEKSFKVGDLVTVKDWGKGYSTNLGWFERHKIPYNYAVRYCYDNNIDESLWETDENIYTIIEIAENIALIERKDARYYEGVYLINTRGLCKVER